MVASPGQRLSFGNVCAAAKRCGLKPAIVPAARRIVLLGEASHVAVLGHQPAVDLLRSLTDAAVAKQVAFYMEGVLQRDQYGYFYGLEHEHLYSITCATNAFRALRSNDIPTLQRYIGALSDIASKPGPLQRLFAKGHLTPPSSASMETCSDFARQIALRLLSGKDGNSYLTEEHKRVIRGCFTDPDLFRDDYQAKVVIALRNAMFIDLIQRTLPAIPETVDVYISIGTGHTKGILQQLSKRT